MWFDYCSNCFLPLCGAQICPNCGFNLVSAQSCDDALPAFTVLHESYVLGRVYNRSAQMITYTAWDRDNCERCLIKEYAPSPEASRASGSLLMIPRPDAEAEQRYATGLNAFFEAARKRLNLKFFCAVINACECFFENHTAYFVKDLPLEPLSNTAKRSGGKLTAEFVERACLPIAEEIANLHDAGFLHCGIRPDNIAFSMDDRVLLISSECLSSPKCRIENYLTIPGISPPELLSFRGERGPWSDVYSFCATVYYLLSGVKPSDMALCRNDKTCMKKLRERNSDISVRVSEVIAYGLEPDYRKRCPNFRKLLDQLRAPWCES